LQTPAHLLYHHETQRITDALLLHQAAECGVKAFQHCNPLSLRAARCGRRVCLHRVLLVRGSTVGTGKGRLWNGACRRGTNQWDGGW
jgi:hypothetical protein